MNKHGYLSAFLLVGLLMASTIPCFAQAQTMDHSGPDLDGFVWLMSSDDEKKSFLFGAGNAVAMEYHIRVGHGEEPSLFVKGWVEALQDVSWSELASRVDDFYDKNPDHKNLHVFQVIWNEVIKPAWNK